MWIPFFFFFGVCDFTCQLVAGGQKVTVVLNGKPQSFLSVLQFFWLFLCVCVFPTQNVNPMMGGSSVAQGRGGPQSQVPPQPNLRNQVPPPILPSQVTRAQNT